RRTVPSRAPEVERPRLSAQRPLCHGPESFVETDGPISTYTVGGSGKLHFPECCTCERSFGLRVSGAVAPSAPARFSREPSRSLPLIRQNVPFLRLIQGAVACPSPPSLRR